MARKLRAEQLKRDRLDDFATAALIGLLSADGEVGSLARGDCERAATWAYDQAEAMERVRSERAK